MIRFGENHAFDAVTAGLLTAIYAAIAVPAYYAIKWVWRNVK